MSARTKLVALLGYDWPVAEQVVDEILNDHAHELAEKIREEAMNRVGWGQPMREAADLIDPGEKQ